MSGRSTRFLLPARLSALFLKSFFKKEKHVYLFGAANQVGAVRFNLKKKEKTILGGEKHALFKTYSRMYRVDFPKDAPFRIPDPIPWLSGLPELLSHQEEMHYKPKEMAGMGFAWSQESRIGECAVCLYFRCSDYAVVRILLMFPVSSKAPSSLFSCFSSFISFQILKSCPIV